ncbi:helix-turn-helix domain-containing protein [Paenibacillus thermotolerans]|uniref:helix-turn-helix domain-containing protein n=1 Tax=Paenibacillus thermotolerans TaxID=3027807 RepID=UPI0023675486|nr:MULTISPECIES: helix-turn-helix domain-containing protein [unclassified Paenibacillus]
MSSSPIVIKDSHRMIVFTVMDYIEEHLSEKLTLHKLSELVSYSPFHFHRLFKAVTDESLNDYVKRTRLEHAMKKIALNPNRSLSEISDECGFSSIADFSRSFKNYFGINASQFKESTTDKNRKICEMDRKITERYFNTTYYNRTYPDSTTRVETIRSLKVSVKQLPAHRVIYDRCLGSIDPYSDQERIMQAFDKVSAWTRTRQNQVFQSFQIGIPYQLPFESRNLIGWRYDACRTIPSNIGNDLGINSRWLAGGTYAVIQLENDPKVRTFILDIFLHDWLPSTGYVVDGRPFLELFSVSDVRNAVYKDLCIPITELH